MGGADVHNIIFSDKTNRKRGILFTNGISESSWLGFGFDHPRGMGINEINCSRQGYSNDHISIRRKKGRIKINTPHHGRKSSLKLA